MNSSIFTRSFATRSSEKEILDLGPDFYNLKEYRDCQKKLFKINQLLGIFSYTKRFLKQFPSTISVLDVGCGGGLFLKNLSVFFPKMQFTGCDISKDAIEMAQEIHFSEQQTNLTFKLQTEPQLNTLENSNDVLLATLVCHHLTEKELIVFLQQTLRSARHAVLINDLHRHIIAYWFYKLASPWFKNRLISHDGLISIKKGFTRKELQRIIAKAEIKKASIQWHFPFRWSIVLWKK